MKISARNLLKGKVVDIKLGAVVAKVTIELTSGEKISSVITVDSVEELDLKVGDEATAIIKSTEVMIAK
ncbi:MAG: TOBE domain-containing protein [Dysgonamonadaceae bacterium]